MHMARTRPVRAVHTACTPPARGVHALCTPVAQHNDVRAHATCMCMCRCMCMLHVHVAFTGLSAAAQLYAKYRELSAKGTLQENINNLHAAPVDSGACPRCNWRLPSTTTAPRRPVWLG